MPTLAWCAGAGAAAHVLVDTLPDHLDITVTRPGWKIAATTWAGQ